MSRSLRVVLLASLACALLAVPAAAAVPNGPSPGLVISEVYGAGGNSGSDYPVDYVELFNRGTATVSLDGKSLQYTSATGTGNFAAMSLSGSIEPGQHVLVQAAGTAPVSGDITLTPALAATAGKVAVATGTTSLGCNSAASCAANGADTRIIDLVGYGNANYFEGAGAAQGATTTTSTRRAGDGCTDTDDNAADLSAGDQDPDNRSSARSTCSTQPPSDTAPSVSDSDPGNGDANVDPASDIRVAFSEPVTAKSSAFSLSCAGSSIELSVRRDSDTTYVLDPATSLPGGRSCTLRVEGDDYADDDTTDPPDTGSDYSATFTTRAIDGLRIHDIQGRQHVSPYNGALVAAVPGVVTLRRTNGFFVQDAQPDDDERTSEGIFVFTSSAPAPALVPGTAVTVSGTVSEFRSGGSSGFANLSTTEITRATTTVTGTGTITPTIIGRGGRMAPTEIIDDDTVDPGGEDPPTNGGSVEAKSQPAPAEQDPTFDPAQDGIDFYESLEGMLTEVDDATAVGPTSDFGSNRELPVLPDGGAGASVLAARGPIVVRGFDQTAPQEYRLGDFNPERIILNDTGDPAGVQLPLADVRDHFTAPVRAVVDYNFGNFKFLVANTPPLADGGLQPEQTRKPRGNELAIASYNVENLDGADPQARYDRIAHQIIDNLRSPDIISAEEIQDNDGAAMPAPTSADVTHARLIKAIVDAGGPRYDYREIDPASNQDGGEPNGNIRVSFLFRTDVADLSFVDHPGGNATTATQPVAGPGSADLTLSPGRIDPTNAVFSDSRKPLVGEFRYRGEPLFVIGNHFNSKGGDDPTFGRFQEPQRSSELQRRGSATDPSDTTRGQAGVVNRFVHDLLAIDPQAHVVALGDLNDFDFSETVRVLETGVDTSSRELVDLWRDVPQSERYSYIYQGNAQVLDHILLSPALYATASPDFEPVHINAEFADQASDHDPPITRLKLVGRGRGGDPEHGKDDSAH